MNHHQRITLLKEIDLFRSFDSTELDRLADALEELAVAPNTVLCSEGEPGMDMFILLDGALQVIKDSRTITTIHPVGYIGEMSIIDEMPRSATVVASTPATLLRIPRSHFQEYLASQPPSMVALIRTLSQRVREDTRQLAKEYEKANILIHDMRNAMTAFLLLDLMDKDSLPPEQRRYLELMSKSRADVTSMMEEALANAKRLHFHKGRQRNSLAAILDAIPATLLCHPDLHDKAIIVRHKSPVPDCHCSSLDIDRVVTNLVINAGQASHPQDEITITLACQAGEAVVEVIDQGTGIPQALQAKIFTPHFSTKPDGNGLGLASCREIITRYGGTLTCQSEEGGGATFRFTLPLTREP